LIVRAECAASKRTIDEINETMPQKKPTKKSTPKPAKRAASTAKASKGFTQEEREAMRDRVKELKAASRTGGTANEEDEVLAKLAGMPAADRAMGERLHAIVKANAPRLSARLWYGMPAYAKDGSVVCHFQPAGKFKTRYATFGFSDKAALDEGNVWPVAFALKELTAADEARIAALLKRAVG
jgi:uncharacterized protein YdhG (YjbR/CyaY superfamily)